MAQKHVFYSYIIITGHPGPKAVWVKDLKWDAIGKWLEYAADMVYNAGICQELHRGKSNCEKGIRHEVEAVW